MIPTTTLRALYTSVFESFALRTAECVPVVAHHRDFTYAQAGINETLSALRTLETAGLLVSDHVNGERALTWQTPMTYDDHTLEQALELFDAWAVTRPGEGKGGAPLTRTSHAECGHPLTKVARAACRRERARAIAEAGVSRDALLDEGVELQYSNGMLEAKCASCGVIYNPTEPGEAHGECVVEAP